MGRERKRGGREEEWGKRLKLGAIAFFFIT
jgi:hypothetical protein